MHSSRLCRAARPWHTPKGGCAIERAERAAAIAYCRTLISELGITSEEIAGGPELEIVRPAAERIERPTAAAPASIERPAVRKPAAPRRDAVPEVLPPVVVAGPVVTVCPSATFDPRYQVDPKKPVEGAGFMSEWRQRRGGQ